MNPTIRLPLLPLRDVVVFPQMTIPLLAGRAKSLKACEDALSRDGRILLVAQRDPTVEDPAPGDLHGIGVIAILVQHLALPEGRTKLLVRGERRAKITDVIVDPVCFTALAEPLDDANSAPPAAIASDIVLADWTIDDCAGSGDRVAALQGILEDAALTAAERLSAATGLLRRG